MLKIKNLVRAFGVLPTQGAEPIPVGKIPDDGVQVGKNTVADNSTDIVHTVTAGKTFYCSSIICGVRNTSGAENYFTIHVRNTGDVTVYAVFYGGCADDVGFLSPATFNPPLEKPAGYDICVHSPAAFLKVSCFVHGYEM